MILGGFQEGIPIAWALSNQTILVQASKERCGPVGHRWFMSDVAPQYYNAWKEVFAEETTTCLWCTWHVDRAWRDGLKRHFHKVEQQTYVYHQLRVLRIETDKSIFRTWLTKFLTLTNTSCLSFYGLL